MAAAPDRDMKTKRGRKPSRARKACASAEAVKAFVAIAPTAVAMTDRRLRFIEVSPGWLEDFGMDRGQILGRSPYEIAPDTRRRCQALHRRCLAGARVSSEPERVVLPNGQARWMMWEAAPWLDDAGRAGGLLITSRNVTAQMEAETELRRTRRFLTTILENVPAPLIVKDEDQRILVMNRAMEELNGAPREEQLGRTLYEIFGQKAVEAVLDEDCKALEGGEPVVVEDVPLVTRHNGVRRVRKTKVAIRDDEGPAYLLSISEDVTDQIKAKEDLERTRAFLTTVLENAPVAMVVVDQDGRVLMMNRAMEHQYGESRELHLGRALGELLAEDVARRALAENAQVFATGEQLVTEEERFIPARGETRTLLKTKVALPDEDGRRLVLTILEDITERKQDAEQIRRTHEFLQAVIDHVPAGLTVKDAATGRLLMANPVAAQIYASGPPAQNIGKTNEEIFSRELAARITAQDRHTIATGEPAFYEAEPTQTTEGLRYINRGKVLIRNPGGSDYLLTVSEDVTDRKKAAEELERTRAFLQTVIDNVPVGLTVKDASTGRVLISNPAAGTIYAFRSSIQSLGSTNAEVFPPELAAHFEAQDQEIIRNGGTRFFEEEPVPTPAGLRYMNRRKVLVRNPDGADYLLSVSEDVTDRRKAVEELERTRHFLLTVINSVPAGITVKDATNGRLVMMNPAVESIYGVGRGENIGKTGEDVFPPEQAERFARQDREVIASGERRTYEEEPVWTKDGVRYLNRSKVLIRNADGPDYLLSISEDVTQRKLAQDALREAVARAEAANVAKSEFLANMSHEIRTPLNGVLGLADALARMPLTPEQLQIVRMIVGSGKALTAILSDVLDLAKAEAGQLHLQPEPFSLRETIGQVAFLFETVARDKGLEFRVDFAPGGPDRLVGDSLRIKQVVSNLISNAVKFTASGAVEVLVRAETDEGGAARLEVTVRDTGPGFSEEVRAKLFSRFQQGDGSITRRFGGTGLGLSIAGALAQMMGGRISCDAAPGEGATFTFQTRLGVDQAAAPADPAPEPRADPPARPAAAEPAGRLRVLLAEDHEVNRQVVRLMLGSAAELVITCDGQQALDAFEAGDPFDVVLMDTQMPVMDGLTAIRRIRETEARRRRPRTPVISLTANAMAHQVEACLAAGADAHLAKPITSEGLYKAIERVLAGAGAAQTAGAAA